MLPASTNQNADDLHFNNNRNYSLEVSNMKRCEVTEGE